jgi:hypothetical protein
VERLPLNSFTFLIILLQKLIVTKKAVVATIEVMGSSWYLADQTKQGYPNQDAVDPLAGRLSMYLNAKDCALEWITYAAQRAIALNKTTVLIAMQAHFWNLDLYGNAYTHLLVGSEIGEYYNATNLAAMTKNLTGVAISEPFQPLYTHLTQTAKAYPNLAFYTVNSDSHIWTDIRANSGLANSGTTINGHHNWMIHQTEGDSRALTMYSKFVIDESEFMPVQVKQIWSKKAYDTIPVGHTYYRYA